jgi:hypothetical protein
VPRYDHGSYAYIPNTESQFYKNELLGRHKLWGGYVRLPEGNSRSPQSTLIFNSNKKATYHIPLRLEDSMTLRLMHEGKIIDIPRITRSVYDPIQGKSKTMVIRDWPEIERLLEANRSILLRLKDHILNTPKERRITRDDHQLREDIDRFLALTHKVHSDQLELFKDDSSSRIDKISSSNYPF